MGVISVFVFYKHILGASNNFSIVIAVLAMIGVSMGKEMLDRYIQFDDVLFCSIGIIVGGLLVGFWLW